MTTLQIIVLVALIALLLIVGMLLLFSGRDPQATRTRRRREGNGGKEGRRHEKEQRFVGPEHEPWDERPKPPPQPKPEIPEPVIPQIVVDAGQSIERPDTLKNRPPITLRSRAKLYHYTALVTSVYDGDTLTADIDLGMNMWAKNQVIRLWKVDTPELRGPEREQGLVVRDLVRDLVLHKHVLVRTILDKRGRDQTGKYGRLLGEILIEDEDGEVLNVNDYLIAKSLAVAMGADGSTIEQPRNMPIPQRSAAPMPDIDADDARDSHSSDDEWGVRPQLGPRPSSQGEVPCAYCGELRAVDLNNQVVLDCPNCIDESYQYGEKSQRLSDDGF